MRSKLQTYVAECLSKYLPGCEVIEDAWPDWLQQLTKRKLQLDFYIPEMRIAIEVQGEQHYRFTPHWHSTREQFDDAQKRDELKRQACSYQNIQLLTIDDGTDVLQVMATLVLLWRSRPGQVCMPPTPVRELAKRRRRRDHRKQYRIYLHDRSTAFKVGGRFFHDIIKKLDLVVQIDRYTAVAQPGVVMWRNQWCNGEPGAVFIRKKSLDVHEEPSPSPLQAE